MERQIPKNVRQIGNVSGSPKIYVEDYVDTFFSQLCEKAGETPVGAFLVGDIQKAEEEEYVYIYGAIRMHELKVSENDYVIDDDTWKCAYEDCKQYFEDGEMLGWFVAQSGVPLMPSISTMRLHKKSFPKENKIFIVKDPTEKEESYFVHKFNELLELGGHYTYYEKNPCMQNYMVSTRKKNGVTPSETVEDRATKDFRSLVRTREEQRQQKRANRAMYMMSACLVLVVIAMGVVTMNNFDKMQSVQSTLNDLSSSVAADNDPKETGVGPEGEKLAKGDQDKVPDKKDANVDKPNDVRGDDGQAVQETSGTVTGIPGDNGQAVGDDGSSLDGEGDFSGTEIWSADGGDTSQDIPVSSGDIITDDGDRSYPYNGDDGVYIVEEGDTLAMISVKIYGDISQVDAISRMNGLTDGNLIYVGQKLLLP